MPRGPIFFGRVDNNYFKRRTVHRDTRTTSASKSVPLGPAEITIFGKNSDVPAANVDPSIITNRITNMEWTWKIWIYMTSVRILVARHAWSYSDRSSYSLDWKFWLAGDGGELKVGISLVRGISVMSSIQCTSLSERNGLLPFCVKSCKPREQWYIVRWIFRPWCDMPMTLYRLERVDFVRIALCNCAVARVKRQEQFLEPPRIVWHR